MNHIHEYTDTTIPKKKNKTRHGRNIAINICNLFNIIIPTMNFKISN